MQRRFGQLLVLAGLLLTAAATLVPLPGQAAAAAATPLGCLVCGEYGGVDVVVNVLLFVPLGLGLRLLGLSTPAVIATGLVISLIVESLQLTVIAGRDASLSDLLTNTLGALIGAVLGSQIHLLLNPTRKAATRLVLLAGLAWLGIQTGSAFLLQPWVPSEPLQAEWARTRAGRIPFDGIVTSALVSGIAAPDGSMAVDSEIQTRLSRGDIGLRLRLISGQKAPDWSPVFELGPARRPVLAVMAAGRDLAFQPPARSYSLRLRSPALRLPHALPQESGKPLQLAAGEERGTVWATWAAAHGRHSSAQALSPSLGWSLFIPFDYAYGPEVHLLTGLWVTGLLAPTGYWAGRSEGDRFRLLTALGALLVAGLGVIPLVTGYPLVHWSEWLAGAAGLAAGWATSRAAAYFGGRCDSPSTKEFC
jgi:hypothetical protein